MASRSRAARELASYLSGETATTVDIYWDRGPGRPGVWRAEWTDGPTVARLRGLATDHARWVRPLDVASLRWSRHYTPRAWAAALLARAGQSTLPDTAAEATGLAESDLHDTDAASWDEQPHHAAVELAHAGGDSPRAMAELLLTAAVMKPRDETIGSGPATAGPRCARCGAAVPVAGTGRPGHWCSPACRQTAYRARVMKPRDETVCAGCGQRRAASPTGRPARWCSPACRTNGWRERTRDANHPAG
jgi:hypothetical protein